MDSLRIAIVENGVNKTVGLFHVRKR